MPGPGLQDTIKPVINVRINPNVILPDSIFKRLDAKPAFLRNTDSGKSKFTSRPSVIEYPVITDTTSICSRNSIRDITFYQPGNLISKLNSQFPVAPFEFRGKEKGPDNVKTHEAVLIKDLRDGIAVPGRSFKSDWMIGVILLLASLYLLVRSNQKVIWSELSRYFHLKTKKESTVRETVALFTWRSTILNFISFSILGIFIFCAGVWYNIIPSDSPSILFILISIGIISMIITSRHFICLATGMLSGKTDTFNEYLMSIYHSYRLSSFFIFLFIILLVYTKFLSPDVYFIAGLAVFGIFYFQRVLKLLLIFLKKNISILYLILYLCALEILPVLILLRYFVSHN
jgi:hypothetical protein